MRIVILTAVVVAASGCLFMAGGTKVFNADAKRRSVKFSSEEALSTFQAVVGDRYDSDVVSVSKSGFAIPFIVAVGENHVLSENAFYNQQVETADGDEVTTDVEARVYAEGWMVQVCASNKDTISNIGLLRTGFNNTIHTPVSRTRDDQISQFKNYKVLRDATLPLGLFTLMIGVNSSGKSTSLYRLDASG